MRASMNKMTRTLKGNSSNILIGAAIITGVLGMFSMYKKAPKIKDIIDNRNKELLAVQNMATNPKEAIEKGYVEDASQLPAVVANDTKIIKTNAFINVCKELAVPVALEMASITCMIGGHRINVKQKAALATAAGTVIKEFKEYRDSVVERFGDEVDKELRYGVKVATIEKTEKDDGGKEKKTKEKVQAIDEGKLTGSDYRVIFDSANSKYWSKDAWTNKSLLKSVQKEANAKLIRNGFLFLNDVRKMLGMEPTVSGQVVGWIWDLEDSERENHVDFNIFNSSDAYVRKFLDGYENCVILEFNVDGVIIDDVQAKHLMSKF